jgi:hypothetical protein
MGLVQVTDKNKRSTGSLAVSIYGGRGRLTIFNETYRKFLQEMNNHPVVGLTIWTDPDTPEKFWLKPITEELSKDMEGVYFFHKKSKDSGSSYTLNCKALLDQIGWDQKQSVRCAGKWNKKFFDGCLEVDTRKRTEKI